MAAPGMEAISDDHDRVLTGPKIKVIGRRRGSGGIL
jgi:hypothetical protein